jgi:hypothetical protein
MTCQDDAKLMGPVSLFLGVETANWSLQQFIDCANFCKQHKVSTLLVKVSEVTSVAGDIWYGGLDGAKNIIHGIESAVGLNIMPYMFVWGNRYNAIDREVQTAQALMQAFGAICIDMEGGEWTTQDGVNSAKKYASALNGKGKLFLSMPANPVDAGQKAAFQAISPAVNVWMPMAYSNNLDKTWETQIKAINSNACIQPTLDLSNEFGPNDAVKIASHFKSAGCLAMSCWEYGFAKSNPGLFDQVVKTFGGSVTQPPVQPPPPNKLVELNKNGCVLDIAQNFQLESGESSDLCGPYSASMLRFAGLPNKGPRGTGEDIDQWADKEVNKYLPNGVVMWQGSSIPDMYNFFTDATDPQGGKRNLHWWDITKPITLDKIRRAVKAGYPVVITCYGGNIIEKKTGKGAYPGAGTNWNHVLPILGIDKDGDFIICDELNNKNQGYWPVVYLANRINPFWASIIQVVGPDPNKPWLLPIPSGDPSTWPSDFVNAQTFGGTSVTQSNTFEQEAQDCWDSVYVGTLGKETLPNDTGIFKSWKADWGNAGRQYGPPLTGEYTTVNQSGQEIVVQEFAHARCEWDGSPHWYSIAGRLN